MNTEIQKILPDKVNYFTKGNLIWERIIWQVDLSKINSYSHNIQLLGVTANGPVIITKCGRFRYTDWETYNEVIKNGGYDIVNVTSLGFVGIKLDKETIDPPWKSSREVGILDPLKTLNESIEEVKERFS